MNLDIEIVGGSRKFEPFKDLADLQEEVGRYLRTRADLKGLKGKALSTAREGLGKIFIGGVEHRIDGVSAHIRSKGAKAVKIVPADSAANQALKTVSKISRARKTSQPDFATLLWMKTLGDEGKWPKGTSTEGFRSWLMQSYKKAQEIAKKKGLSTNLTWHAGHGVSADNWGPQSPSNLASQPAFRDHEGLIRNVGRKGADLKDAKALTRADVSTNMSRAFAEYLMESDGTLDILKRSRFTDSQWASVLHRIGDPEGLRDLGLLENENKALTRFIANNNPPNLPNPLKAPRIPPNPATGLRNSPEALALVQGMENDISIKQIKGSKFSGNVPTSILRSRAKQLALLGIAGVSVVGTGASAAETAVRTDIARQTGDWRDKAQAGISGFSLANDVGSYSGVWALPGAVLSTGADGLNWLIDDLRSSNSRLKQMDWDAIGRASSSLGGLI